VAAPTREELTEVKVLTQVVLERGWVEVCEEGGSCTLTHQGTARNCTTIEKTPHGKVHCRKKKKGDPEKKIQSAVTKNQIRDIEHGYPFQRGEG